MSEFPFSTPLIFPFAYLGCPIHTALTDLKAQAVTIFQDLTADKLLNCLPFLISVLQYVMQSLHAHSQKAYLNEIGCLSLRDCACIEFDAVV